MIYRELFNKIDDHFVSDHSLLACAPFSMQNASRGLVQRRTFVALKSWKNAGLIVTGRANTVLSRPMTNVITDARTFSSSLPMVHSTLNSRFSITGRKPDRSRPWERALHFCLLILTSLQIAIRQTSSCWFSSHLILSLKSGKPIGKVLSG